MAFCQYNRPMEMVREIALTAGYVAVPVATIYGLLRWFAARVAREQRISEMLSAFPSLAGSLAAIAAEVTATDEDRAALAFEDRDLRLRTLVVHTRRDIDHLRGDFRDHAKATGTNGHPRAGS